MTPEELRAAWIADADDDWLDVIVYENDEDPDGWDWDDYTEEGWGACVAEGCSAIRLVYDLTDDTWITKRST